MVMITFILIVFLIVKVFMFSYLFDPFMPFFLVLVISFFVIVLYLFCFLFPSFC